MPAPALSFDRVGCPEPLYYQLALSVEHAVDSGTLPPGTKLPPEKIIAEELHVSVGTIRRAWGYLERRGLITVQGRQAACEAQQ